MSSIIFSILGIYLFIVVGFVAKMSFKEDIHDRTITLINVYFLQVFLTFWGLLVKPIDSSFFLAPLIYFFIIFTVLAVVAVAGKWFFSDQKEYSIATVAALIGNTGNLGIPLNIAIFGEESIPYTTVINLVNVLVIYTFGVFYYSRGNFDTKTSLKNIVKLPIIWAVMAALALSYYDLRPNEQIMKVLMTGAYASIAMQLLLFGIYLYGTKIKEISIRLVVWVMSIKLFLLPLFAIVALQNIELSQMAKGIIFIEVCVPLAIANVNFASLYDCKPKVVTALVFISSLIFLGAIFFSIKALEWL